MAKLVEDFEGYYREKIAPLVNEEWVRADSRRCIKRLSLMTPRHRIHLKTYCRIEQATERVDTKCRDLIVFPFMCGKIVGVHGGKSYVPVTLDRRHVGFRLGDFVYPKKAVHKHTSKTRAKLAAKK